MQENDFSSLPTRSFSLSFSPSRKALYDGGRSLVVEPGTVDPVAGVRFSPVAPFFQEQQWN